MNKELMDGLTMHLIKSGLTYNAEVDPVVVRPVDVQVLLPSIMEYLIGAGYAEATKVS